MRQLRTTRTEAEQENVRSRDMCDDVDVDELRALRLEAGAPESLLDEGEEGAAVTDWTHNGRHTSGWRENKSLMTVVSASLSRIPLGSTFFPAGDGAGADGTTWGCGIYRQGSAGARLRRSVGEIQARPPETGSHAGVA
jgi:hypothetical protein